MRQELANAAFDLVLANGYEQTVEELADALGISRATFFRHLGSKEEIVVVALLGPEELFAEAYARAGLGASTSAWQRLKAAFEPVIVLAEASPERMRARLGIVRSTPALGGRLQQARRPQIDRLAGAMVEEGHDPFAASILATAAVAAFIRCWVLWAEDESLELRLVVDRAFAHLDAASSPAALRSPQI